jgi:hypothetical protein
MQSLPLIAPASQENDRMSQIPIGALQWITQGSYFYSNLLNYFLRRSDIRVFEAKNSFILQARFPGRMR